MIHVEEIEKDLQWDERVRSVPYGTIYQTTMAARAAEQVRMQTPHFLIVRDGGRIIGQLLYAEGHLGRSRVRNGTLAGALFRWVSPWFSQGSFSYGPLVFEPSRMDEIVGALLEHLKAKTSFSMENLLPPMHSGAPSQDELNSTFVKWGFTPKPHGTFIVDLTTSIDALWGRIAKSSRYGVRRTQKQCVQIVPVKSEDDFQDYYRLMQETFERNRISFPFSFHEFMDAYSLYPGHHSAWMTRHEGKAVSALSLMWFNGIGFQYNVCHSDYGMENKIYGNDLLEWHAITSLHEAGNRYYDLAGVTLEPKTDKEKSLFHFKSRWGGDLVPTYMYSFSKSRIRRGALTLAKRIMR